MPNGSCLVLCAEDLALDMSVLEYNLATEIELWPLDTAIDLEFTFGFGRALGDSLLLADAGRFL